MNCLQTNRYHALESLKKKLNEVVSLKGKVRGFASCNRLNRPLEISPAVSQNNKNGCLTTKLTIFL